MFLTEREVKTVGLIDFLFRLPGLYTNEIEPEPISYCSKQKSDINLNNNKQFFPSLHTNRGLCDRLYPPIISRKYPKSLYACFNRTVFRNAEDVCYS
jgi:hypothetical protein